MMWIIAVVVWLAFSVPLALFVGALIKAGRGPGVD